MRKTHARLAALASLLLLVSCSRGSAPPEPARDAGAIPRWNRIVSAGGSNTETLFALGLGERIAGVDTSSLYPPEAVAKLPRIGYQRTLAAEGILSLRPDVVLVSSEAGPPNVLAQIRGAGVHVEVVPAEPSVAGAVHRVRLFGKLFARDQEAEAIVARIEAGLAEARKLVAARSSRPRVVSFYARGAGTVLVAGKNTPADVMIGLAGGDNVATFDGYKPIVAEAMVSANPNLLLVTTRGLASIGGAEGLYRQPGIALTDAGKKQRLVTLDDLLMSGFGPRLGQAVLELATAFGDPPGGRTL